MCEAINSCADFPEANAECKRGCSDDFDDAEEFDGDDCVDSRLVAFSCVEKLSCEEILEFVNLEVRAQDLADLLVGDVLCVKDGMTIDCCEAELATVIGNCEKTFDLK